VLKRILLLIVICIPLVFIASGCAPTCTEYELDHNSAYSQQPADGVIVGSLNPTLEWSFTTVCNPHEFRITLNKNYPESGTVHNVSGNQRNFTISNPLEAGGKYFWNMYTTTADEYNGRTTRDMTFYTGPTCSNITPVAPVLDIPADGEFVTPEYISSPFEFHWHYPEYCLPSSFHFEFALDPGFATILYSGDTPDYKQFVEKSFSDCTTVYWHVAAKNGNLMGPYSETRSFSWIWDENCWMNHYPSDDFAEISGRVYREICTQTGIFVPSQFQLAPGCTRSTKFGVHADGIHSYNEHGLYGVEVNLGAGPCPSIGLENMLSYGANGKYKFVVSTPGEYCVSISNNQTGHDFLSGKDFNLWHGLWTQPITYDVVTGHTISLGPGYHEVRRNFGWDQYDVPIYVFKQPTFCRQGPDPICNPLRIFELEEFAPMMARNAAGTWIMTSIQGEACYFYNFYTQETKITEDDVDMPVSKYLEQLYELEVFPAPPPCLRPTPTPKPSGGDTCSRFTDEQSCIQESCKWHWLPMPPGATGGPYGNCTE